jgi:hypothetical protein
MVGAVGVEGSEVKRPHVTALLEARRRDERKRNLTVLAIVLVLALLLAAFAYRPATVIGVHGEALAHSVRGSRDLVGHSRCVDVGNGRWRCQIMDAQENGAVPYVVTTSGPFGCWSARRAGPAGDGGTPKRKSGCIDAVDVLNL